MRYLLLFALAMALATTLHAQHIARKWQLSFELGGGASFALRQPYTQVQYGAHPMARLGFTFRHQLFWRWSFRTGALFIIEGVSSLRRYASNRQQTFNTMLGCDVPVELVTQLGTRVELSTGATFNVYALDDAHLDYLGGMLRYRVALGYRFAPLCTVVAYYMQSTHFVDLYYAYFNPNRPYRAAVIGVSLSCRLMRGPYARMPDLPPPYCPRY